ncbi:DNA/RNA nuclease SfsA [Clostridium massiliamazoniense]|uniref:DNA/RNA nuclease SfsA n=1 Tax=Clostridium massiliamazoniense TaxID=1347366 RepID=UPI0006D7FAEB|nr:DNA/RNA nuclease SfsA [Clostridium massiliamazoniense]
MYYNKKIVEAKFLERPNRFQGYVELNGERILTRVPNTGRCKEILIEGCTILLREENNPKRKTRYDLIGAYKGEKLIIIDSQIPNKVVEEALINKKIGKLTKYNIIEREKTYGKSRFDFRLSNDDGEIYYLEVKGVTLENNKHCKFPDAPTERGKKHILELVDAIEKGYKGGILFLIQLEDVYDFTPNYETDPAFGEALKFAKDRGIDIFVYNCKVTKEEITLLDQKDIIL